MSVTELQPPLWRRRVRTDSKNQQQTWRRCSVDSVGLSPLAVPWEGQPLMPEGRAVPEAARPAAMGEPRAAAATTSGGVAGGAPATADTARRVSVRGVAPPLFLALLRHVYAGRARGCVTGANARRKPPQNT